MATNKPLEPAVRAIVSTGAAADLRMSGDCTLPQPLSPCTLIIFGATGDLAVRKLLPALFNLFKNNALPPKWAILGCGRSLLDDEAYRGKICEGSPLKLAQPSDAWAVFSKALYYQPVD